MVLVVAFLALDCWFEAGRASGAEEAVAVDRWHQPNHHFSRKRPSPTDSSTLDILGMEEVTAPTGVHPRANGGDVCRS